MNIVKDLFDYLAKFFTWWIVVMPWEQGIRVTLGKKLKLLNGGIYAKFPLIHTCYVQEKRMRVINLPIQTVSTSDGFAITVSCSIGYSITDIVKLYNTLYQPDMTIQNMVSGKMSEFITRHPLSKCLPGDIEEHMNKAIKETDYGLEYNNVTIINFASVKTFRLIQDQTYLYEGLDMIAKK